MARYTFHLTRRHVRCDRATVIIEANNMTEAAAQIRQRIKLGNIVPIRLAQNDAEVIENWTYDK